MPGKNSYIWSGWSMLVTGLILAPVAYFLLNLTWLSALGICMLILAFILLALGRTVPRLSPEVCSLLLETGIDNLSSILEELGVRSRAIYLPSSITGDIPRALIPLHDSTELPRINQKIPRRFITTYGTGPENVGLLVSTIGSSALRIMEALPAPDPVELETSLTSLFRGKLGIADGARVECRNGHIMVDIQNPHMENTSVRAHRCLGSPLASLVAAISAETWGSPVAISKDEGEESRHLVELEVLE